jgi:hypothetical protein
MESRSIEEHQLDYDWRFAEESATWLAAFARSATNVLLLGCPSLAAVLGGLGRQGQVVERNPNYISGAKSFKVSYADLRFDNPALGGPSFSHTFVDPPWYPQELLHWTNFGLSRTKMGGSLLFSLWPDSVRPSAQDEHHRILAAMSEVGKLEHLGRVSYRIPHFEREAHRADSSSASGREGLVFRLTKNGHRLMEVEPFQKSASEWLRFTLSGEQLAILVNQEENTHHLLLEL